MRLIFGGAAGLLVRVGLACPAGTQMLQAAAATVDDELADRVGAVLTRDVLARFDATLELLRAEQGCLGGRIVIPGGSPSIEVTADVWLTTGDRYVVIGEPGSGKSAFLRYVLLDLLSDEPPLPGWAKR